MNEKYLVHKSIDPHFSQASYEAFIKIMPELTVKFLGYVSPWSRLLLCSLVTVLNFSKELSSLHTILILTWSKSTCIFVYPSIKSDKIWLCSVHPTCLKNKFSLYTFTTTVSESRYTTWIISKLSFATLYYITAEAATSWKQHFWEEYFKPNETWSILSSFCIVAVQWTAHWEHWEAKIETPHCTGTASVHGTNSSITDLSFLKRRLLDLCKPLVKPQLL